MKALNQEPQITQYLLKLDKALKDLPQDQREDIVKEIHRRIYDELDSIDATMPQVKSILKSLGSPRVLAKAMVKEHLSEHLESASLLEQGQFLWKQALVPFLLSALLFTVLFLNNTIYVFSELFQAQNSYGQIFQALFFSLPAIFVVILPLAISYAAMVYSHKMATYTVNRMSQKLNLATLIILMGLFGTFLSYGIQDILVPQANQKTVEILKEMIRVERSEPKLNFSEQKDIREMSSSEAKQWMDSHPKKVTLNARFDYFNKFALPLACLACALWGGGMGLLTASGFFNTPFMMFVSAGYIPMVLYYSVYSLVGQLVKSLETVDSVLFLAMAPLLPIFTVSLVLWLGYLFQKQVPAEA